MEDANGIIARKVASPLLLAENYSGGVWKRAPHLTVIDYEFMRLMTDPSVDTLIVRMPPRHGKSWYLSRWAATWFHLMNPYDNSMLSSYSADLAKQHGEWVRDAVHRLAPLVGLKGLSASSRSKSDWKLDETFGGMLACGLLGSQTGRGAKLILIDDYMRGVEDASSQRKRDAVWEWFRGTISTRREPGARIVILCCLTGDTKVRRPDGSETELRLIKQGDVVATFDGGKLSSSKVVNHASVGHDDVLRITLSSGRTIRGNARHPFLVESNGRLEWVRLRNLNTGSRIVTVLSTKESHANAKDAISQHMQSGSVDTTTTRQGEKVTQWSQVTGVSGRARHATGMGAISQLSAEAIVPHTMQKNEHLTGISQRVKKTQLPIGSIISDIVTDSRSKMLTRCSQAKMECVQFVGSHPVIRAIEAGKTFASTTATKQAKSEDCCVLHATLPQDMLEPVPPPLSCLDTSVFTSEEVISIEHVGREELFDLEVERTSSFIANGMVSHNTQWHSDDLIGRIMAQRNDIGLNIRSITLQAIREENDVKDPLRRQVGEALWPSQFSATYLINQRKLMGEFWFNAQYQGRPILRVGKMFKFQTRHFITAKELPTKFDDIIRFWDRAATEGGGCYSVGVLMARAGNRFYVLDVVREQLSGEQVQGLMLATALLDKLTYGNTIKTCFEREGSGSGKYVAEMTVKEFSRVGLRCQAIPPMGGKEYRAEPFAQAVSADMVYVIQSEKWTGRYIDSLGMFPNGKYKDDADASAGAYKELTDPTDSGEGRTLTLAAKSSVGSVDSYHPHGQCQCEVECKIPAFAGTYCCLECESTGGEKHSRECMAKYNDWYIRHSPD